VASTSDLVRDRGTYDSGADNDDVNMGVLRGLHSVSLAHKFATSHQWPYNPLLRRNTYPINSSFGRLATTRNIHS
ncbi:uncharacterized protein METZ01_LOCUS25258, partial [marine metagenome]